MGWVPSAVPEKLGKRQRGYVRSPQRIECDICHSQTKSGFYNAKEALETGTFWPDRQQEPCRAFCPRCGLRDAHYKDAVWQSLNARNMLVQVDNIMEEYWGPVPPPAATLTVITLADPGLHGDGEGSEFQMVADDGSGGPPQLPPAASLENRVAYLEGQVARLEQVILGLLQREGQVQQREQQQSPLTSEERPAEEGEVLPAPPERLGRRSCQVDGEEGMARDNSAIKVRVTPTGG